MIHKVLNRFKAEQMQCCKSLNNKAILFYNQKGNRIFASDSKKMIWQY